MNSLKLNQKKPSKLKTALIGIDGSLTQFIIQIIKDVEKNPEKFSIRTDFTKNMTYTVQVADGKSGIKCGVTYPIEELLDYCKQKKIEFILNTDIRRVLLEIKANEENTEYRYSKNTLWI